MSVLVINCVEVVVEILINFEVSNVKERQYGDESLVEEVLEDNQGKENPESQE